MVVVVVEVALRRCHLRKKSPAMGVTRIHRLKEPPARVHMDNLRDLRNTTTVY